MNRLSLSVAVLSASAIFFAASSKAASVFPESTITVSLPTDNFDTSVPIATIIVEPMATTLIDPTTTGGLNYIGFQGDFTFDPAVVSFVSGYAQKAGLTSGDWNISGTILTGPGTLKTARFSAISNDFTPLNGSGVLFNLRMRRVSNTPGEMSPLVWKVDPSNFVFLDENLETHAPNQANGLITITTGLCDLTEGFDDITTLVSRRWFMQNNSQPGPGATGWFQGIPSLFPSQSGPPNSYNAANYDNGTGASTLSNWLLTPNLKLQNGAQLTFWTRTVDTPAYADRLQVRMSTNGMSTNVGTTATDVGDFTSVLLDINPTYTLAGYPNAWTQFTVTLGGLGSPTTGRLAFRYFVENGGPAGTNSDYIGIDTAQYACNAPTPTPTPIPTPTPTPTPTNISGTMLYCSNPVTDPVANVTLTRTGSTSGSTLSDGSGNYMFSALPSGGSYTVMPSKAALTPGSSGIDTVDVVTTKKHYTTGGAILSGCGQTAADVTGDGVVDTFDVIAIQRFFLGLSTAIANTGKYKFIPASRSYPGLSGDQTAQNYDTLIFGDVTSHFAERVGGASQSAASGDTPTREVSATAAELVLPEMTIDQSKTNFIAAVRTLDIDAKDKLVGFQGDFTFDERVVTFQSEPVQKAGLTAGNWNVSGNVLPGSGPIRTLRISAFSDDFTPLSGSGTLFELRMTWVSKAAGGTQLLWAAPPNQFIFIDADLNTQTPGSAGSGGVTSSGRQK